MEMNGNIQLNRVNFEFRPGEQVLTDVTLAFRPGEFVGIVGPNASGKTTLTRLLNASLQPSLGTVMVGNLRTAQPDHFSSIKSLVALIGSDPENQLIASSVYEEIALGLRALGLKSHEIGERCEAALTNSGLQAYRHSHPFFLSTGGQFQLLLAVALVRQPRFLVLDEVLAMLDGHSRQRLLDTLLELCQHLALGLIVLSHRLDDLMCADRLVVLKNGQVVADGHVTDILSQALITPNWQIEAPHVYHVCHHLSLEQRKMFPELCQGIPESFL